MVDKRTLFLKKAELIPNWQKENKNTLIRKYIENKNNSCGDAYLSAIILRYWSNIYKYSRRNPHFDLDTYLGWYLESIMYGINRCIENRNDIMSDKYGPDKVINRSIRNIIINHYEANNKDKRKSNLMTSSLDVHLDGFNSPVIDSLVTEEVSPVSAAASLVQYYIDNNDFVTAIFVDMISFNGNKKFSKGDTIKCIREADEDYIDDFTSRYNVGTNERLQEFIDTFHSLQQQSNVFIGSKKASTKLHRKLTKVLSELKYSREVHDTLCC